LSENKLEVLPKTARSFRTKENDDEIADELDSSSEEEVEAEDAQRGNSPLQGEI